MANDIRTGSFADRTRSVERTVSRGTAPEPAQPAPAREVERRASADLARTEQDLFHAGAEERSVSTAGPAGTQVDAYVQGPSFDVDGTASAQLAGGNFEVDIDLKIDANLVEAGATVTRDINFRFQGEDFSVRVTLGADGQIGANGELQIKLSVGRDGVTASLGAEGFVGARGSLSGSIDVSANGRDLVSTDASVTFAAGAMAGASLDLGLTHFEARAYAAVGAGVGVELAGTLHARNVARLLPQLVEPSDLRENARFIRDAAGAVISKLNPFD